MVGLYGDFKQEIEAKPTGKTAVTYFIMNGIEQPHAKRTNKKGKSSTLKPIIIECLDIYTINRQG